MRWYWWGAGRTAKEFFDSIGDNEKKLICGFIDNDSSKWGSKNYNEIPVLSPFSLKEDKENCRIVIPVNFMGRALYDIQDTITNIMGLDISVIRYYYPNYPVKSFKEIDNCRPYENCICTLGYFVRNDCNMRCRACVACSPLVKEKKKVVQIDDFCKDIERLKELFPYIYLFSLQGGEITLDEELMCDYIKVVKNNFPYTILDILTNGTRLRSLKEKTIDCIRENNIRLRVSLYPYLRSEIDEIIKEYRIKGIEINIDGIIKKFGNRVSLTKIYEKTNRAEACKELLGMDCWSLSNGKMSRCQFPRSMKIFNDYFDLNLPTDGEIDIFLNDSTEIYTRLNEPIGFCEHCRMNEVTYNHDFSLLDGNKVSLAEWIGE